jgi:hypothetical protein
VLDRILEKIIAAAKRGNEWIDQQTGNSVPTPVAAAPVVEVPPTDDVPEFLR